MAKKLGILVRVFVEVADERGARSAAQQLEAVLSQFGPVATSPVRRYWKIPEYYELQFRITPVQADEDLLATAAQTLGSGWSAGGTTWKVWTPEGAGAFIVRSVRWAHVETLE